MYEFYLSHINFFPPHFLESTTSTGLHTGNTGKHYGLVLPKFSWKAFTTDI